MSVMNSRRFIGPLYIAFASIANVIGIKSVLTANPAEVCSSRPTRQVELEAYGVRFNSKERILSGHAGSAARDLEVLQLRNKIFVESESSARR
jgi:hypothetical protein